MIDSVVAVEIVECPCSSFFCTMSVATSLNLWMYDYKSGFLSLSDDARDQGDPLWRQPEPEVHGLMDDTAPEAEQMAAKQGQRVQYLVLCCFGFLF